MNTRLILRITAPVVAISLLLLAVGVGAAWHIHDWQKTVSRDLRVNISGVRAAEELEILVRETRTRLDHFLITGDRKYLTQVVELRPETERWLRDAERWGVTPHEQELMRRVRRGEERFWSELERITQQVPPAQAAGRNETTLSLNGKLLVLVSRFLPRLADLISKRKVRGLFREEIEQRRAGKQSGAAQPETVGS